MTEKNETKDNANDRSGDEAVSAFVDKAKELLGNKDDDQK